MQNANGQLRYSRSDVTEYLAYAHGERPKAYVASECANLMARSRATPPVAGAA
jgi:hypothetical protein